MALFNEYQAMLQELEKNKLQLAERKVIDKAKGILMQQQHMNEQQAYQALGKLEMDRNKNS